MSTLAAKAAKAKTGMEPNPITVACAHAGYEAVRSIKRLYGDCTGIPFEQLKAADRDVAISDAWDVMSGDGPEALYAKYDHGGVLWSAADPVEQMQWVLFTQTVATQMKATFALAQAAKNALER